MYCIYQIDGKLNEQINFIIESETDFYNKVVDLLALTEHSDKTKYSIIDDTSINHIKLSSCFYEGLYLIKNYKCIRLIKKYKCIVQGCLYNSESYDINILFTWKLINFDPKNYNFISQT